MSARLSAIDSGDPETNRLFSAMLAWFRSNTEIDYSHSVDTLQTLRKRSRLRGTHSNELDGVLGTMPDREVAERYGISFKEVHWRRTQLGIPSYRDTARFEWTTVRLAQLGTQPDSTLAEDFGLSIAAIRQKRVVNGIPSYRQPQEWPPERIAMLGTMPDSQLARMWGIPHATLAQYRQRIGIASFRKQSRIAE